MLCEHGGPHVERPHSAPRAALLFQSHHAQGPTPPEMTWLFHRTLSDTPSILLLPTRSIPASTPLLCRQSRQTSTACQIDWSLNRTRRMRPRHAGHTTSLSTQSLFNVTYFLSGSGRTGHPKTHSTKNTALPTRNVRTCDTCLLCEVHTVNMLSFACFCTLPGHTFNGTYFFMRGD